MNNRSILASLVISLLGIAIGILFFIINSETVLNVIFTLFGILSLIIGFKMLFLQSYENNGLEIKYVTSIAFIVAGLLLIVVKSTTTSLILGILLLALSLVRIIKYPDKKLIFKKELFNIVFGAILVVLSFSFSAKVLFYILGAIIILASIFYLIYNIYILIREKRKARIHKRDHGVIDL